MMTVCSSFCIGVLYWPHIVVEHLYVQVCVCGEALAIRVFQFLYNGVCLVELDPLSIKHVTANVLRSVFRHSVPNACDHVCVRVCIRHPSMGT